MTLYLADASAVEYWRRADPSAKTRARAATPFGQDRETPPFSASDLAALEEAGVGWLSEPIHLLVPDASSRRRCKRTKLHVCSHRLPERSFVKLSRHVMVASPELTCLSIAPSTPFPLLVEFCTSSADDTACPTAEEATPSSCRLQRPSPASSASPTRLEECAEPPT